MRKRLARQTIPELIVAQWEKRFDGRFLPLQHRTIEECGLLDGASLLISAPTSSGKTLCGEMALMRAVQQRKKAIFLVPLKAVAEEKYRHFIACYGPLGLRIIIATRDHPDNDGDVENGRFDIAVMVYEKFNSLLLANFDLLAQVGTVVVDEFQMLEDESRGPQLELALTKLLCSGYRPQLVALSAVVGEAVGPAAWMECRLVVEKSRPVELRRGVVTDGTFCFRCHNSGETGEETFKTGEDGPTTLFENIKEIISSHHQALVFLKARHETVVAAGRFVEYAGLVASDENRAFCEARLGDQEPSSLLDNLRSLLACGVAFHNADLTAPQRLVVEDAYREGRVKVIFATTTLSTGINLPAATVFIEAQKYRQQGHTGRPALEPLSWAEYESMSGRAGRVGMTDVSDATGRAVLFASSELEKSILWEFYIEKHPVPIQSRLSSLPKADIVVDLFASGLAHTPDDVVRILQRSYHAVSTSSAVSIEPEIYDGLLDKGFLTRDGDSLAATPLGKATAITGLGVAGTADLLEALPAVQTAGDPQIIYQVLQSPEGRKIYLPFDGHRGRVRLPQRFFADSFDGDPLLRDFNGLRRQLTPDELRRLKLTFLLIDWMNGLSLLEIENGYRLYPGMMESVAQQAAWLLASAGAIIRASDRLSDFPCRLDQLAFSVGRGLPPSLKSIVDAFDRLLFRGEMMALYRKGINDLERLLEADAQVLKQVVSSAERFDKIDQQRKQIKEESMNSIISVTTEASERPNSIEIEGTPVRERFLVRIDGRSIGLTGKSFKYLLRLVWSRLTKDGGWLYKEDLEQGFNQARYLYRLRQEIGRDFMPRWPLYENNRSGYYRLAADPEQIRVNLEALRDNPDFEIRQMILDLAPQLAS
jgi:helicase